MIKLENVGKIYSTGNNLSVGIRKVNLELDIGEFVAITGESGSGKSTLLNIISGIDSYEEGEMYVDNQETSFYSNEDLEEYRNKYVGFIFQAYNIIDSYTVLENVEAALLFLNIEKEERKRRAIDLITKVGLEDRMHFKASKLSGGEKQRVVIARALAKDSPIIAADEPTGNLDEKSSKEIIELLYDLSKDKLVLIVTHDFNEVEMYASRILRVYDGEIIEDRKLKDTLNLSEYNNEEEVGVDDTLDTNDEIVVKKNKRNIFDDINFYLKDLVSSPKRMIFYFIVIFLLSFFSLVTVAGYEMSGQVSSMGMFYGQGFENDDIRRIVVNKKNRTKFTDEELNNIKSMSNVDFIVESDYLIDQYQYIDLSKDEYEFISAYGYTLKASLLKESDLKYGRLPSARNEIVITLADDYYADYETSSFVDKVVLSGQKIVGIIDPSKFETNYETYVYLYDEDYNDRLEQQIIFNTTFDSDPYLYFYDIEENSTLKDNEIGVSGDSSFSDNYSIMNYFIYKDYYHDLINLENMSIVLIKNSGTLDLWYPYKDVETIYLSTNNYNKYKEALKETYQLSIYLKNSSTFNHQQMKKQLEKLGYSSVSPYTDGKETNIVSKVFGLMLALVLIMFFLSSTLIVYFILSFSIKSRTSDVEILRTIGAKEKDISRMITFELLFIGLISYLIIVIGLLILKVRRPWGDLYSLVNALGFIEYVIIIVLILAICVSVSNLLTKKMFNKTVKKSLDQR